MARPAATAARARRSKSEVQQEFLKIKEDVKAERDAATPKLLEAARAREAETRRAVEGVTVDIVVRNLSGLSLEVSRTLGELSEKLVQEVERLAAAREAVALEQRELERLHRIDVAATALDQLVHDYEARKQALDAEIAGTRAAWDAEVKERERTDQEREEALKKQRQREAEDYEYKKTLERKKAQDRHEEEVRQSEKQNREKQEALEKSWQERDAALTAREEELERLRREVADSPARLGQQVERAVAEATRQTEQRLEQQIVLLQRDAAADQRVAELQVKAHKNTIARQAAQIEALQRQLDEAKQQVQQIAVKAIEGASGAQALDHVNKIAMEHAKTRPVQG